MAQQREAEATGAEVTYMQYIPDSEEQLKEAGIDNIDIAQDVDDYRTERGHHTNAINRCRQMSMGDVAGFDAFHLAESTIIYCSG